MRISNRISWEIDSYALQVVLLSLVIITLPISIKLNSVAIILWAVHSLVFERTRLRRNFSSLWENDRIIFIVPVLYLLQILGLVYTEDFSDAFQSLETKLSLLLLPLLIIPMDFLQKSIHLFIKVFIFAILGSSLYCHTVLISDLIQSSSKVSDLFTSYLYQTSYLTEPLGINPIYFSLYVSFSLLACLWFILNGRHRYLFIMIYVYLQLFNLLLISRTALVSQLFLSFAFLIVWFIDTKAYGKIVFLFFAIILLILILIIYIPNYSHRFSNLLSTNSKTATSTSLHVNSWLCGLNSNKGISIVIGQGSGDEVERLSLCYLSKGLDSMVTQKLNSHSEYLSAYVRHGLIGLLLFGGVLISLLVRGVRKKNSLLILFTILFALVSITESTLTVQKGVIFFSLFSSLLLNSSLKRVTFADNK